MSETPEPEAQRAPKTRKRSGSERRRKYANLTIRLLPEERAKIEVEADRAGLSLGAYVRVRLSVKSDIRAVRRAPVDAAALARILAQLGRVGGNLHQLIRHLNMGNHAALAEAREVLAELRGVAAEIMGAMGRPPRGDGH